MLVLLALALAANYSFSAAYQAFEIFYDAPNCALASISEISLLSSNQAATGGSDLYTFCALGQTCTASGSGSYERVCVSGGPVNLGVLVSTTYFCDNTATYMPFTNIAANRGGSTVSRFREFSTLQTWRTGCHLDSTGSYNFASVNSNGTSCSVYYGGNCGNASTCSASDCSGSKYELASHVGCNASSTDYIECSSTAFNPVLYSSIAELFVIDESRFVWYFGECTSGCYSYNLGDEICNPTCNVAACDFDCGLAGDCDCCLSSTVTSCCSPPQFASSPITSCCNHTASGSQLGVNNTFAVKVFDACLCDKINTILGLNAVLNATDGLCSFTPNMVPVTSPTYLDDLCQASKIVSYCQGCAMALPQYTAAAGTSSVATAWLADNTQLPLPSCIGLQGSFHSGLVTSTVINLPGFTFTYNLDTALWYCEYMQQQALRGNATCNFQCGSTVCSAPLSPTPTPTPTPVPTPVPAPTPATVDAAPRVSFIHALLFSLL
jgi:hypothetical protein